MAKLKAVRNISNRTLELLFENSTERILPNKTGKFHSEKEWKGSFAEKQANEFVKRHEAKYVEKNSNEVRTGEVAKQETESSNKKTTK